ncbi:alpha-mannosyltransferase CYBJADRAFT_167058 [Cyberlindnera jadinii NRRL Y-1542]|uniref:Nucleotide-diphospho-sugar transferase n=1 Tax=Cyberlindnera jadinii (strain ATCC 18201 / CBS 1600 / BCRC 20928 / JCM 3617 / NBRC 0987 / NRRL Y-1542) TaxID=983966 RepID=A0A1E4S4E4_CYBJN|nr:hypothetical protein CYBJADRAFT_167058 [Cyberlindnera jadinii NRRL Y-1542]ODV74384.1 hypothetical protein CYBJADRAFT_167058 [Cyberlindnera jadinii NRRL Y-1542]
MNSISSISDNLLKARRSHRRLMAVVGVLFFICFEIAFFTRGRNDRPSTYIATGTRMNSAYKGMLKEDISSMAYGDRCSRYFGILDESDPKWEVLGSLIASNDHEKENKDQFVERKTREVMNQLPGELSEAEKTQVLEAKHVRQSFEEIYDKLNGVANDLESNVVDSATSVRVYGACYLDQFGLFNNDPLKNQRCSEYGRRLFKWHTGLSPVYTRWNGEVLESAPVMANYIKGGQEPLYPDLNGCMMYDIRSSMNGKGIAISASDSNVDALISLFAMLRAVGNQLPVQVVHAGNLSPVSANRLLQAANSLMLDLDSVPDLDRVLKHRGIAKSYTHLDESELKSIFPPLELWYVDASRSISPIFLKKFSGAGRKLLALFFNSFEHTLMIDSDVVPLVDLGSHIFNNHLYREHGALFFRGRELEDSHSEHTVEFFKSLMPTKVDELIFHIPSATEKTLGNRFMEKEKHPYMDASVLAIDRKRYMTGILSVMNLKIWKPVEERIRRDKEMYWLGMSIAGLEDYYMNHWTAGAVGSVTPVDYRLLDDKIDIRRSHLKGHEICSSHAGHLSPVDNTTMLWMDGGASVCKYPDSSDHDFKGRYTLMFKSKTELREHYTSTEKITALIITSPEENKVTNNLGENDSGWGRTTECRGSVYCAYDRIGGRHDPNNYAKMITFNDATQLKYNFVAQVGRNAKKLLKY